ncbi:hypothetical protein Dimus_016725 [Dionaea muscipula]
MRGRSRCDEVCLRRHTSNEVFVLLSRAHRKVTCLSISYVPVGRLRAHRKATCPSVDYVSVKRLRLRRKDTCPSWRRWSTAAHTPDRERRCLAGCCDWLRAVMADALLWPGQPLPNELFWLTDLSYA